jgi:hypothetical protein
LERALVAEIGGIEVPEEGNPFARFFALFHACHPLWRPCENILRDHVHDANLRWILNYRFTKLNANIKSRYNKRVRQRAGAGQRQILAHDI